jgi:hypothetical protein
MTDWHTKLERELIRRFGGEPTKSYGADGMIDGEPVEVRAAKKDDRFRLNRETHAELVDGDGSYIFDDITDDLPAVEVEADEVDEMIDEGDWFSDRGYEHKFLSVDDVFK